MNIKPNVFELEASRIELTQKLSLTDSVNLKISLHYNFFQKVLSTANQNFIEAFLTEYIKDYLKCITGFQVSAADPNFTKSFITQLKKISEHFSSINKHLSFDSEIERIEKQYDKLCRILNGEEYETASEHKAYFPLIEKSASDVIFGGIDSVTVRINKSTDNNKFIIIPSERELETRIIDQIHTSWQLALELSKKYLPKPNKYHEVIINFDNRLGFYEGNSLGTALTLSFLEQLLKFYNPVYIININDKTAFTGGVDNDGKILTTGEEIIKQKVKVLFFSEIKNFVFPKCEENYAYFALTQLQKDYPKRKLKLIPVEDFTDVINRRDLVDINKQKIIVRAGKFGKKNLISAVVTVLLALLFAFLFVMDFDDNPALLESDGTTLFVKNKNGKVLWIKKVELDPVTLRLCSKIVDIDNDGKNEVLICGEFEKENRDLNSLICYNNFSKTVWKFSFYDSVISQREILDANYSIKILDTLTFKDTKSLYLIAENLNSFSSCIFRIDPKYAKRLPGTFWASGHIMNGVIKDIDDDNHPEIVAAGYENGYEDLVFFVYGLDTLTKVRPTTKDYLIRNYPLSEMKSYIRFPKTDFDKYFNIRTPGFLERGFHNDVEHSEYDFATSFPKNTMEAAIGYEISYNFKEIHVVIDSDFRVQRDTLVAHGKLNLPYTDTEEYKEIIKNNILYWKDGKWVKRNELD